MSLESRLETSLFDRRRNRRLSLTAQGKQFYAAVTAGLDNIRNCMDSISGSAAEDQLTIACTHEISHLFLLPRFDALQRALGERRTIRVMSYEYETMERKLDPDIDILFRYDAGRTALTDRSPVLPEAVVPVVSPSFYRRHRGRLESGPAAWSGLAFLELSKPNHGWATWSEWFARQGRPGQSPDYLYFNNYVYLLEAAAAGKGIALGWRGLVDRHLDSGVLRGLGGEYTEFDRGIYAVLTDYGKGKPLARRCLDCLVRLAGDPVTGA
jgi:LysR family glycine cleavage system transcriptional activator